MSIKKYSEEYRPMMECFHLLELIQNAPPYANAYIDSSQHSENVIIKDGLRPKCFKN
jgi:hypothetical protein